MPDKPVLYVYITEEQKAKLKRLAEFNGLTSISMTTCLLIDSIPETWVLRPGIPRAHLTEKRAWTYADL